MFQEICEKCILIINPEINYNCHCNCYHNFEYNYFNMRIVLDDIILCIGASAPQTYLKKINFIACHKM